MNDLTHSSLIRNFPSFDLSYETVSHKKDCPFDSIALAIPLGRKYFIWFTYSKDKFRICYLLGLNKEKQISSIDEYDCKIPEGFELGTIIYCSQVIRESDPPIYVADDIYQYRGVLLHNQCFGNRVGFLRSFVEQFRCISLPIMWIANSGSAYSPEIPEHMVDRAGYTVHHIQYKAIERVSPYINVAIPKKCVGNNKKVIISSAEIALKLSATTIVEPLPYFRYDNPAFRYPATFIVKADPEQDLYHLYAYGGSQQGTIMKVYCGLACIQSLQASMFMNKIFRFIRENSNLDLGEESEEEEVFENTDIHKFVDLSKTVNIECIFNERFKKWTPVRISSGKIIHIGKLCGKGNSRR
jgi:hypothetical protein